MDVTEYQLGAALFERPKKAIVNGTYSVFEPEYRH